MLPLILVSSAARLHTGNSALVWSSVVMIIARFAHSSRAREGAYLVFLSHFCNLRLMEDIVKKGRIR